MSQLKDASDVLKPILTEITNERLDELRKILSAARNPKEYGGLSDGSFNEVSYGHIQKIERLLTEMQKTRDELKTYFDTIKKDKEAYITHMWGKY